MFPYIATVAETRFSTTAAIVATGAIIWKPGFKPGFHIIAPVATVVAVVEKRVLTQKYFLSDASDTVFPYDRRCRSISLKLGRGDLGSITKREFGVIFKMPADANEGIEGIDLSFFKYLP